MPGYRMDFEDGDSSSDKSKKRTSGCYVSGLTGFVLVILVILIAVGVGVIVFFAKDQEVKCTVGTGDGVELGQGVSGAVRSCQEYVENGGNAAGEICGVCPASTPSGPATTTPAPSTTGENTTTTPAYPRDGYRLPQDVIPSHYTLRLQPHIYGSNDSLFYFEGDVVIDVRCAQATDVITLHVNRLTIDDSDVTVVVKSSQASVGIQRISYEQEPQFYHIHLGEALAHDEQYQIRFALFRGNLTNDGQGLYISSYKDGDQTIYLATTQFEAPHARKAFPCFDEPALKATFDVTLVRKTDTGRHYRTLSNTNQRESNPLSGGWVADVYETTMVMPTYLLAFIVCDYDNLTDDDVMGIRYSTWARPNAVQYAQLAQDYGPRILRYFEERFRPLYSSVLDKMDHITIPDFSAGAMENWGLVTYRERLLYKPGQGSAKDEYWIALVIAHEITHMWFGNLVTPQWWDWLWLNEALASYWPIAVVNHIWEDWRMTETEIAYALYSVMASDALASSHPMTADVETRAEIGSIFSEVTYSKGEFISRMMNFIMGEDKYIEGLNKYLTDNAFGNVRDTDLLAALDAIGSQMTPPVNMTLRLDPWVRQMGYPVVTVTRLNSGHLRMSQQRFLLGSLNSTDDRYKDPPYNYQWEIPITITSSQNPNFQQTRHDIHWLQKDSTLDTIQDPTAGETNAWFIVNVQQQGYYRVNYDAQNWDALIAQLNTDHTVIDPINRGQLINDAWNLVKADMLDMSTALRVLDYLSMEKDYLPWSAFAQEMDYVELMLDRSPLYTRLEEFMQNTVSGPLQELGLDISEEEAPVQAFTKQLVADYACSYGLTACVNLATQQFGAWLNGGSNSINANLRYRFYCTAVQNGGLREWNFVYSQYKTEDDANELARLRRALACTREPSLLHRLLEMTLESSEVRPQDTWDTIRQVAANRWGRDMAFHFVVDRFSTLTGMMDPYDIDRLISSVTAHFNSEYDLTLLQILKGVVGTDYAPGVNQATAQTQTNMGWLDRHRAALTEWLQPQDPPPSPGGRPNYRLPAQFKPSHYTVRLQPYIYGNDSSQFYFSGTCTIRVTCTEATSTITLHMDRLNVSQDQISVKQVNSQKELFRSTSYEELRGFYHLHLSEAVQSGKDYIIDFGHFTGPLRADASGFYLSYYREGERTVYLATTQMEPPYARKAFPCFDEPALKARFDITLVRRNDTDRHYRSLANSPQIGVTYETDSEGHVWAADRFNTTPIMPTYLLAFVVSDFVHVSNMTAVHPIQYSTWARPGAIQWAQRPQEMGLKLFDWMDARFQPPYKQALPKLDSVAVPDFNFGAMENWGLIIYRDRILYQPGVTSAAIEFWTGYVTAHEIAHMWFGDYVSPQWWDYIWLNEAFATFWHMYATNEVFSDWKVLETWLSSNVYSVLESDALATSHPMTSDVQTPAEIISAFDGVTYHKGAAMLRMVQFVMGFDRFLNGLNLYLANNLYGNAEPADLWRALDQQMIQDHGSGFMMEKMDPWVSQMGYPVVMVTRTARGYQLTQQRFLIGSTESTDDRYKDAPYDYQWEIPVVFATSDKPDMEKTGADVRWLSKNSELILPEPSANDTDAWILINLQQIGFFRVLYDNATWRALIAQLNSDLHMIPPINRGLIINDAWNLAKAGLLDMSIALATLDFLQGETELPAWRAFAREMNYVELMLERTDLFPLLRTFMQETLSGPLRRLTLNIPEGMVPVDVFVRTLLAEYACSYGVVGCVNEAKRLFAEWKNTGINGINANLRYQFYCTAVAEGDSGDWSYVYHQFQMAQDTSELDSLRHALTCSKDPVMLRRLLHMAIDEDEIRTQDLTSTIQWVASNPLARDMAFQFFVDKFDDIRPRLEPLHFARILLSVTSHFNREYDLQQLEQLKAVRDTTTIRSAVEQATIRTRTNIAWLDNNYNHIMDWLHTEETPRPPVAEGAYRLPKSLEPSYYELRLQPHIYGNDSSLFFFEGSVAITFLCKEATRVITLHQDRLTINTSLLSVTDDTVPPTSVGVTEVTEEEQFHFYHIHVDSELQQGHTYTLRVPHFRGDMRRSDEGLYLSSYRDGDQTIYLATTQMEPTFARQVFPCFDEPALKATFDVTLVRRTDTGRDYIALSNMPNISSSVVGGDGPWTEDVFQTTMVMPTYLLAFIVCDFKFVSNFSKDGLVETRTYARPNRIQDAVTAQRHSVDLFEWFNSRFLPPYQTYLNKVDHIAIPDFRFGAMENWGLITYRENLLYNSMSTADDMYWTAVVPSHELAHMWFGNKVSPLWWDWLWLNEAFADYYEAYAVEQVYPERKTRSVVNMAGRVFSAMFRDSFSTSHPMTNPVETPGQIMSQFDIITYVKGGAIIHMMNMILGEHFTPSLNHYLQKMKLGNAKDTDLFDALDEYIRENMTDSDLNMTDVMDPWVKQMGYPVVTVHRGENELHITQERFLLGEASASDIGAYGYKYDIPITYTTSAEKNFINSRRNIHWLRRNESMLTIPLPEPDVDWVVVNLKHEGYYRVLYDADSMQALITQLISDPMVIDQVNRATILDDAWNLVKADKLPLEVALQTLDYMGQELDFAPWRVFARETAYMERMIERTELFADFQRFMQSMVSEPLKTLTFEMPADNDPPIDAFVRTWVIADACKYDHKDCVTKARGMVNSWMLGSSNDINVNLRSHFYCTAVREGGHDVWQFIYQQYQQEQDGTERSRLRSALGCSTDPTILMTFLDMCLHDDEVPRGETSSCLSAVAANRYGRDVALNFVMENFPTLLSSFSSRTVGSLVSTVTQHFHTNFHLAQLQFLKDNYDVSGITTTLETVQQTTVTNMKWMDKNFDVIKRWLQAKASSEGRTDTLNYRLPTTVKPHHYDLTLQPDFYHDNPEDFSFNGTVNIRIECINATDVITLHAYLIDLDSIRESAMLNFENGTDSGYVQEVTYDEMRHFLHVHLKERLMEGEVYQLYMEFRAQLPGHGLGLYYSSYMDGNDTVYLVATQFEATDARRAFPCFDEPQMKAYFNVTLIRRKVYNGRTYRSWSNNRLLDSTDRPDLGPQYVADRFEQTLLTSTYLLAFTVADFLCLTDTVSPGPSDVMYSSCARPNAYQYGELAQEFGVKGFRVLEGYFQPHYDMPKLDNMAIPGMLYGGMENWGLVIYREDVMLYEPGETSASTTLTMLTLVAHELAHMWFGNIVSPKWWGLLWLKEGFATYWGFFLVQDIIPQWRMEDQYVVQAMYAAMAADSLLSSHPLTADVESPSEIDALYDAITYDKGAAFVRMVDFIMGRDNFIGALNVFLHNKQYSVADQKDLFDALDEYARNKSLALNLTDWLEPWVSQANYPVVTVGWTEAGRVTLTQRRFLSSADQGESEEYTWDIPITISSSSDQKSSVTKEDIMWLHKNNRQATMVSSSIPVPGSGNWILLNVQQYGFYRVNYDVSNWQALIAQLETDPQVIPVINRGQIINDAWSLAKAGQLDMNIALRTFNFLKNDSDYVPWQAMARELSYLDLMLAYTPAYGMFQNYVVSLVNNTYESLLGTTTSLQTVPPSPGLSVYNATIQGEPPLDKLQRALIMTCACRYGLQKCQDLATSEFVRWQTDPDNYSIDVNMRSVVYCSGVRYGSEADWSYVLHRYRLQQSGEEKSHLRAALACTREPYLLRKLLELARDRHQNVIDAQDTGAVLEAVSANPYGRDLAVSFLKMHFHDLANYMTPYNFGMVIVNVMQHFNEEYQLNEVRRFMTDTDITVAESSFRRVLETTKANMAWMDDHYNTINTFLTRNP